MNEGGGHAESNEPKTWEPPCHTMHWDHKYNGYKRDPNKGELLQLPKEVFKVLPCHIMTAISSDSRAEIKIER